MESTVADALASFPQRWRKIIPSGAGNIHILYAENLYPENLGSVCSGRLEICHT